MNDCIISASILNANYFDIKSDIQKLKEANIKWLHLDVMDGMFVQNISFGIPFIKNLKQNISSMVFDTHLMIEKPERYIENFIDAGSDIITFHYEATDDIKKCIDMIKSKNILAGISIRPVTPVEEIYEYIKDVDLVLIMSVNPGFGGQKFIEATYERVKKVKEYSLKIGKKIYIQVDGGVNKDNINLLIESGVNTVVIGSAIFKGNIVDNVNNIINSKR